MERMRMMEDSTLTFLRKAFREHYFRHPGSVEVPSEIASREFGYIPFGGGMVRHISFKNPGELVAELVKQAPSSVFCSNATYEQPTLPMDEKGWKGAELIFDIDADSIPTPCKVRHAWWYCRDCHKGGKGPKPAKCPSCHLPTAEQVHWSCRECLGATKEHVIRLVDFLVEDFGMSRQQIRTYFSGNRGYHAHVKDERFETADPPTRAEIANYVKGTGFDIRSVPPDRPSGAPTVASGWGRRTNLFLSAFATTAGTAPPSKRKNHQKLAEQVTLVNAALIDESVTTDIHRVFRMPGTLHGSSGLLKKRVESLERFDPQVEPVALSSEDVRVHIYYSPEFDLNGMKFGPYESSTVQIPIYAAAFLLARGLGRGA